MDIKDTAGDSFDATVVWIVLIVIYAIALILTIIFLSLFAYHSYRRGTIKFLLLFLREKQKYKIALGVCLYSDQFSTLHHGKTKTNKRVLVSIYNESSEKYFQREKDIHVMSDLQHDNILKFLYSEKMVAPKCNWWLVFEGNVQCTLRNYLSMNQPTTEQVFKMVQSLAAGLSYLHEGIAATVSIAHRDISSCNILVGDQFICIISNFRHSVRYVGGKLDLDSEIQVPI